MVTMLFLVFLVPILVVDTTQRCTHPQVGYVVKTRIQPQLNRDSEIWEKKIQLNLLWLPNTLKQVGNAYAVKLSSD